MDKHDKVNLFNQVVKGNCEMLINGILTEANTKAVLIFGNMDLTEDELRNKAVELFYYELSKRLTEHLKP